MDPAIRCQRLWQLLTPWTVMADQGVVIRLQLMLVHRFVDLPSQATVLDRYPPSVPPVSARSPTRFACLRSL